MHVIFPQEKRFIRKAFASLRSGERENKRNGRTGEGRQETNA